MVQDDTAKAMDLNSLLAGLLPVGADSVIGHLSEAETQDPWSGLFTLVALMREVDSLEGGEVGAKVRLMLRIREVALVHLKGAIAILKVEPWPNVEFLKMWAMGGVFLSQWRGHLQQLILQTEQRDLQCFLATEQMVAWRLLLMWRGLNYMGFSNEMWSEVYAFYLEATKAGYVNSLTWSADNPEEQTSVEKEFLHLLALSVSMLDCMSPDELVCTNLIARHLARALEFSAMFLPGAVAWLNFDSPSVPCRMLATVLKTPGLRFVGVGRTPQVLRQLNTQAQDGELPEWLQGEVDFQVLERVVARLRGQWSEAPRVRRQERQKVDLLSATMVGLPIVFESVLVVPSQMLARLSDAETWSIRDISAGGFGFVVPDIAKVSLSVGSLLAIAVPNASTWRIAVVRRLRRESERTVFVGAQLLSGSPQRANYAGESERKALILADYVKDGEVGVLLPREAEGRRIDLEVRSSTHIANWEPGVVWEVGPDYVLQGYREQGFDDGAHSNSNVIVDENISPEDVAKLLSMGIR